MLDYPFTCNIRDTMEGASCLQPDLVLVSQSLRKIADGSGPWNCLQDGSLELLAAAHERKVRTYAPLLEALQAYLDEGWQVESFPWAIVFSTVLRSSVVWNFSKYSGGAGGGSLWKRPRSLFKPSMSHTAYAAKLSK